MLDYLSWVFPILLHSCLSQSTGCIKPPNKSNKPARHSPGRHPVTLRGSKPWAKKERHQGTNRKPQTNRNAPRMTSPSSWRTAALYIFHSMSMRALEKVNRKCHINQTISWLLQYLWSIIIASAYQRHAGHRDPPPPGIPKVLALFVPGLHPSRESKGL